jgi:DNA-binding MarR family transcriptional regulator
MMLDIGKNKDMLLRVAGLARALRCCQQETAFCENLTFTQFFILETVGEQQPLRLSELHEILGVDKSTTTRLVNPLVEKMLVTREKSETDGRAVNLKLTAGGQQMCARIWSCVTGYFNAIEAQFPEDQRASIYAAIQLFSDALVKAGPSCCAPQQVQISSKRNFTE